MATLRKITLNWEIRTGAITCDTGYIKRQELCDVDLYVTVDGTAYAFDTSWALNLSFKPTLLGDNAALIAVTTWTASETTGLYQATAQTMGGTALDTYLAANNADTTDDEGNKLVDLDVYYTISTAVKSKSDTVTLILKPDVGRADDTVPATIIARNDFLVSNGTGLLINVAAGYAANGAFVAAQASLAITNATNYIEVTAAGVASVNTTAFTAGSYPLATVVASAGAITSNTDLRAWITPKPATSTGLTVGTTAIASGTTTRVLFDNAGILGEYTISGTGSVAMTTSPTLTTPALGVATATTINGLQVYLSNLAGGEDNVLLNKSGTASISTAIANTGVGSGSLLSLTTGDNNCTVGYWGLINVTTGSNNSAFGANSLRSVGAGGSNTAVGYSALALTTGSRNVGIGFNAGQYETGDDSLYIDNQDRSNTAGDKAKALLYGTFAATAAAQQLTINAGTITLNGSAVTATSFAGAGTGLTGTAASLTAGNATKWTTGRTIALTGDVTYTSGSLDGSGNVTGVATLANIPAISGANLTTLNASNISSGTLADARNTVSNTTTTSMANLVTVGTLTGGATGAGFTVALSTSTITGNLPDARNTVSNSTTTTLSVITSVGNISSALNIQCATNQAITFRAAGDANAIGLKINNPAGAASNHGYVTLGTSTTAATVTIAGSGTNYDLTLTPKGSGVTNLNGTGAAVAGTLAVTGATTLTEVTHNSANSTGVTTASSAVFNANSLTTGTGIYLASSTLTSGKAMDIQVSGTAAAASQTALNVATAGANGTSGITSKGAVISNTHTGTTSTNTALELTASGGTTNVALNATAGHVLVPDGSYVYNTSVSPSIGRSAVSANSTSQAGLLLADNSVTILTNSIRGFSISGYGAFGNGALITGIGTSTLTFSTTVISTSVLQSGEDKTSTPNTGTVRGGSGSGTNIAGGVLHIQGGASTGSAAGGSILLRTTPAGGSGSSANAAVTALTIDSTQAAAFAGTLAVTGATTLTGNLTSNGALISTPQALTGAGAVNVTTLTTAVTTTAPAQALTLADGTNGQIKTIVHQALSGGGTWVLTPTTKTGYTTITSIAVGETCTLQFFTTIGWCILSLRGAIAA